MIQENPVSRVETNQVQHGLPQRLVLKGHPGTSVTTPAAGAKKWLFICFFVTVLFSLIGGGAGWMLQSAHENRKQYDRYASELGPLIYYKNRVHSAKERGSNTAMRVVNYKIYQAYQDGLDIPTLLAKAQPKDRQPPALAELNEKRFLDNLRLGLEYGIYEGDDNLEALAYGKAPTITKGSFKGQQIQVEHIVPRSVAPDLDNILANLMWYPASLNQQKNDIITQEALKVAEVMKEAGILAFDQYETVKSRFNGDFE